MYDSSKLFTKFFCDCVRLTGTQQTEMRDRRNLNRDRIQTGLAENQKPAFVDGINQGGYAMKTMTQSPEDSESAYDIDYGLVFEEDDVATPKTTRKWVLDALAMKATSVKGDPEDTGKCIRIEYSAGYQCDFPVFKRIPSLDDFNYFIALADEWVISSPQQINDWFDDLDVRLSPATSSHQFRRIVTLIKYLSKVWANASGSKYPSGLLVTALVAEQFRAVDGRLDQAFYETLRNISSRSAAISVYADGILISGDSDTMRIERFCEKAKQLVELLEPLEFNPSDYDEESAKKIWKKVFRHSFFDAKEEVSKAAASASGYGSLGLSATVFGERAAAAVSSTAYPTKPFAG